MNKFSSQALLMVGEHLEGKNNAIKELHGQIHSAGVLVNLNGNTVWTAFDDLMVYKQVDKGVCPEEFYTFTFKVNMEWLMGKVIEEFENGSKNVVLYEHQRSTTVYPEELAQMGDKS